MDIIKLEVFERLKTIICTTGDILHGYTSCAHWSRVFVTRIFIIIVLIDQSACKSHCKKIGISFIDTKRVQLHAKRVVVGTLSVTSCTTRKTMEFAD